MSLGSSLGWNAKSKSSSVLTTGNRALRNRFWSPLLSRLFQFVVDEVLKELEVPEFVFESLLVVSLDGVSGASEAQASELLSQHRSPP
jgi:hypothetical protein